MSNEQVERVARVIRPWLSQTMQDPDDWSETRARDIAADVIAHAMTPTPQVVETVEELEALAHGTPIIDADDNIWTVMWPGAQTKAMSMGRSFLFNIDNLSLPAQVLYPHPTPDVDVLAEVRAEVARLEQHAELSPDGYDTLNALLNPEAT